MLNEAKCKILLGILVLFVELEIADVPQQSIDSLKNLYSDIHNRVNFIYLLDRNQIFNLVVITKLNY